MKSILRDIINVINQSENILILPSSPPDGDSLGSATALCLALQKYGKTATVICSDPVPEVYQFLPEINQVSNNVSVSPDFIVTIDASSAELAGIHSLVEHNKINIILSAKKGQFQERNVSFSQGPLKYDLIITVDTAVTEQLGQVYQDNISIFSQIPVINIDHHPSNEGFGRINYVDIMSSSTCEMILELLTEMEEISSKELVDSEVATSLLAGIITDTGSFQHSNTTPRSFSNSAKLIRRGARQQEIIQHVYKTKHLSTLRLWGRVLSKIVVDQERRFLWSVLTRNDFFETRSREDETGSIIDEMMTNAPDVDLVILLKEKENGQLACSIRTIAPDIDASELASHFGGGGHAKAASFKLPNTTFAKSGQTVIDFFLANQQKRLGIKAENATAAESKPEISNNLLTVHQTKTSQEQGSLVKENQPEKSADAPKINPPQHLAKDHLTELKPGVIYKFES